MLCNMCIKQDVCKYKFETELAEKDLIWPKNIELDCKHRHAGTTDEIQGMRERETE